MTGALAAVNYVICKRRKSPTWPMFFGIKAMRIRRTTIYPARGAG
jgi:hypothetical protein